MLLYNILAASSFPLPLRERVAAGGGRVRGRAGVSEGVFWEKERQAGLAAASWAMMTPVRATAAPAICNGLIGSANRKKPRMAVITGWISTITEAVAAGSRPSAQAMAP